MARIVQLFKILGVTGCCPHAEGVTFLYAKQSRRGKKYLASSKALQHVPVMLTTPCFRESHRPTCGAGASTARDRSPAAHQVSRICLLGALCVTDANTVPLGVTTVTLNKHAGRPQLALHSLSASAQRLLLSVFNGLTANMDTSLARAVLSPASLLGHFFQPLLQVLHCTTLLINFTAFTFHADSIAHT